MSFFAEYGFVAAGTLPHYVLLLRDTAHATAAPLVCCPVPVGEGEKSNDMMNTVSKIVKYDYIDAMRGWAILGVVSAHCVSQQLPIIF